jgi:hypothetical protein
VLTKEIEVTYATASIGELSAVSADVRHESAFAPNAPYSLKNFQFTCDYAETGAAMLMTKRHGPLTDVPNGSGGFTRAIPAPTRRRHGGR